MNSHPMSSCFCQSRYGGVSASWRPNSANQTYRPPYMGRDASDRSKNGVCGSVSERSFRSNNGSSVLNYDFHVGNSSFNGHHTKEEFQLYSQSLGSWRAQIRSPSSIQSNYLHPQVLESRKQQADCLNNPPHPFPPQENQRTMLRRKSPELDLNLSLRPAPKIHDRHHQLEKMDKITTAEIDSSLSLSLFSSPSPSSKLSRLKEENVSTKHVEIRASTLDLTL